MKIVRGFPTGPAVLMGSFMGVAALGVTVFAGTGPMWVVLGLALLGMLAFYASSGQLVNHLNVEPRPNWAQAAFCGVLALVFGLGANLVNWYTEPLIVGPMFAVFIALVTALGFRRWCGWVVREEPESAE